MPQLNLGIFGQSFAQALIAEPNIGVFREEFKRVGWTVKLTSYAIGGSSVLKENRPNDQAWWLDLDTKQPGPALINTIRAIGLANPKPTRIIWAQGEGDSVGTNPNPDRYIAATTIVHEQLRLACSPSAPNSIGIIMHIIGRRVLAVDVPGVQIIREAQLKYIRANTSTKPTAVLGWDTFDLPLIADDPAKYPLKPAAYEDSHFTTLGNAQSAWRAAQRTIVSIGQVGNYAALTSLSRVDDRTVKLRITSRSPLKKPVRPALLAVRSPDGVTVLRSENELELAFEWKTTTNPLVNDLLIQSMEPILQGAWVLVPYGMVHNIDGEPKIDRVNIIRDAYDVPIQSTALQLTT